MGKKWYSYFVVTDDAGAAGAAPADAALGEAASGGTPGLRAIDTAPAETGAVAEMASARADVDLDLVYRSAQIAAPVHGYTVLKVAEMLRSEHIRTLPNDVKRKSVMVALDAAGVKVTDIVEDAVRRDRALDTYEKVLERHVDDLRARTEADNATLEAEIQKHVENLRARIADNVRQLESEVAELAAWRARKHQEEATIADAVSHFVSENPITTTATPVTPSVQGDPDDR